MEFDIRTDKSSRKFLEDFLKIDFSEVIRSYCIDFNKDIDKFYDKYSSIIKSSDVKNIDYIAFHVTSNSDSCSEIKKNGIRNLQRVLIEETKLKKLLLDNNIKFDIGKMKLYIDDIAYNINYKELKQDNTLNENEINLKYVARKIYDDYQINGFFYTYDVKRYGTNIHKRPEFLLTLSKFKSKVDKICDEWNKESKGYIISYRASFKDFKYFTFFENKEEYDCDYEQNIMLKKLLIQKAIEGTFGNSSDFIVYMKNDVIISSSQILDIKEI